MNNINLKNPNNDAYWQAKGYKKRPKNWKELIPKQSKRQLNREKYDMTGGILEPFWKEDY